MDAESYIKERVMPRVEWYDRRATINKAGYLWLQGIATVAGIIVIPLIHSQHVDRDVPAWLAAAVAALFAVERILRCRELWHLYRTTSERLLTECYCFRNALGDYAEVPTAAATRQLQTRTERIMSEEMGAWSKHIRRGSEAHDVRVG